MMMNQKLILCTGSAGPPLLFSDGFKHLVPSWGYSSVWNIPAWHLLNFVWESLDRNMYVCTMQQNTLVQRALDRDLQHMNFQRLVERKTFLQLSSWNIWNLRERRDKQDGCTLTFFLGTMMGKEELLLLWSDQSIRVKKESCKGNGLEMTPMVVTGTKPSKSPYKLGKLRSSRCCLW